jgi:hypothetical protein
MPSYIDAIKEWLATLSATANDTKEKAAAARRPVLAGCQLLHEKQAAAAEKASAKKGYCRLPQLRNHNRPFVVRGDHHLQPPHPGSCGLDRSFPRQHRFGRLVDQLCPLV